MEAAIARTTAFPALRAGIAPDLALLLRCLSSQASLSDEPKIWIKRFSTAETLVASPSRYLGAVDDVSIVDWKTFLNAVSSFPHIS